MGKIKKYEILHYTFHLCIGTYSIFQFLEKVTHHVQVTVLAVDKTSVDDEFICLIQDCPEFEKLRVHKTIVKEAFNMDNLPRAEDL